MRFSGRSRGAASGAAPWRDARDRVAAADLAAGAHEAVDAARAAGRRGGRSRERVVGDVGGPAAGPAQHRRQRAVHVAQRRPARRVEQPGVVVPAAERERAPPAQDRVARRDGRHRLGEGAREAQPLAISWSMFGVRIAAPVDGVRAQRVDDDQDQVRPVGALGERAEVAERRAGRGGGRACEEAPACVFPAHLSSGTRVGCAGALAARERSVVRRAERLERALEHGLGAVAVELRARPRRPARARAPAPARAPARAPGSGSGGSAAGPAPRRAARGRRGSQPNRRAEQATLEQGGFRAPSGHRLGTPSRARAWVPARAARRLAFGGGVIVTLVPQPEGSIETVPLAPSPSQATVCSGSSLVILISPNAPRWRARRSTSLSSLHSSGAT